ncbi:cysteine hydrolase family protein [Methylobacterium gnaphalii]|uniref:Cysteine hydrolase n=1 Tax=Methylobacterium gnaphalii TaxID=1010610 RepID=A0A512JGF9_9HYPH|nr:isochorismatase family cysteine hydrolase [Methylobacterium gnaphalii]GEP09054.1 cysteine hydrolase [Methylobacterium gnaphalii]GJD68366.1 hypothetical protein MMMDOFMJ_1289 [Methylobacterium gnaphalii]GLS48978.1 cysteine hydrolase [Methylobacterium gnaphalii]
MRKPFGLRFGPLNERCAHLCVDAQRMFAEETAWHTPWLSRVLPNVARIATSHPGRTIFTRFLPARSPTECSGAWRRYYEEWPSMTLNALGEEMTELCPSLAGLVPPARIIDKRVYSPWMEPDLDMLLADWNIDTLIVTGGETDVCVLASVLGAVDRGYRVILAADGLCSSADETHDAMMTLYGSRFGEQIELTETSEILAAWPAAQQASVA